MIIIQFLVDNKAKEALDENRYMKSIKIILEAKFDSKNDDEINNLIQVLNLKISNIDPRELIDNGKIRYQNNSIKVFLYNKEKYIQIIDKPFDKKFDFKPHFKDDFRPDSKHEFMPPPPPFIDSDLNFMPPPAQDLLKNLILHDEFNEDKFRFFWCFILFIIDILLIWFLLFLRKKLKPLLTLKDNIILLSQGNFSISTKIAGKDEISQVANEFDNAIKQLRELRESRNLFLRNIMHELKTPITKGKLVTDMYDDCERKHILTRILQ